MSASAPAVPGRSVPGRARGRRYVRRPPDLTSLFDVMFIVVFVALIRAAAAQQEVAALTPPPPRPAPPEPPRPPPPPPSVAALRTRALAHLERDLAARTPIIARIGTRAAAGSGAGDDRVTGTLDALEVEGRRLPLDVPLLTDSRDPDIEVAYQGDRSAELRVCRLAAVHLRAPDLTRYLVVIVPDRPLAEIRKAAGSVALLEGLERDVARCFVDQRGIAALIDPADPSPAP